MSAAGMVPSTWAAPLELTQDHEATGRRRVAEIQRTRIIAAMVESAAEIGVGNVTVAHVVDRAGVSRRTFYELFASCDVCFLEAFEESLSRARERVAPVYSSKGSWREGVRASLATLLRFVDDEPAVGRLLIVESLRGGMATLQRRQEVLATIATVVDEGGQEAKPRPGLGPLAAEATVGAVFSVIHARMVEGGQDSLVGLVNPLMSAIVLPYLGTAAARRELSQPIEKPSAQPSKAAPNPLKDLEIRLTYRTVRTLAAVAANPRSSNRVIAEAAGITDQGQVSKLLARLQKLGLVENRGPGSIRGEPNSWLLTPTGKEVHNAIAA